MSEQLRKNRDLKKDILLLFASFCVFFMYAENLAKRLQPTSKDSLFLGLKWGYLKKKHHCVIIYT